MTVSVLPRLSFLVCEAKQSDGPGMQDLARLVPLCSRRCKLAVLTHS